MYSAKNHLIQTGCSIAEFNKAFVKYSNIVRLEFYKLGFSIQHKVFFKNFISEAQYFKLLKEIKANPDLETRKVRIDRIALKLIKKFKRNPFNISAGYRRVYREAIPDKLKSVIRCNTVKRLMRTHNMGVPNYTSKATYNSYNGDTGREPNNYINNNFFGDHLCQKMYTDVTLFKVRLSNKQYVKLYFAPIYDAYNNEILTYNIHYTAVAEEMIVKPLHNLKDNYSKYLNYVANSTDSQPILHSDQGCQYKSDIYEQVVKELDIRTSMSEKGNCNQNACVESFFGRFKDLIIRHKNFVFNSVDSVVKVIKATVYYWNYIRTSNRTGLAPIAKREELNRRLNLGPVELTPQMAEGKVYYEELLSMLEFSNRKLVVN